MQLSRQDIVRAAEEAGLDENDYTVRDDYRGWDLASGSGVCMDHAHLIPFMDYLELVLADDGRAEDALDLANKATMSTRDGVFTVYWPGVQIAD
jgi:hypothetical protein